MKYTLDTLDNKFLVLRPENKLTDSEYNELKPVIESMGGHWREKVHGFTFPIDTSHTKAYTEKSEKTQFFPTPKAVAKRLIELSEIDKHSPHDHPFILEPSAGQGSLLDALPTHINQREYVVEPDAENAEVLRSKGHLVEETTFENFYKSHKKQLGTLDYVFMNPPFSESRDALHTMMAFDFLKEGGVLLAVVSENSMYYENDASRKFKHWLLDKHAYIEEIPYGTFKESGTNIDTVIIKVVKQ